MDKPTRLTPAQIRAGYARNSIGLRTLAAKAARTGRKVNGADADYWQAKADEYTALSTASDDALRAHLARPRVAVLCAS